MSIQSNKLEAIQLLLQSEDAGLIKSILQIIKSHSGSDIWQELTDDQKSQVERGISEIKSGFISDYEEVLSPHK